MNRHTTQTWSNTDRAWSTRYLGPQFGLSFYLDLDLVFVLALELVLVSCGFGFGFCFSFGFV
jgi:hypothetical protein